MCYPTSPQYRCDEPAPLTHAVRCQWVHWEGAGPGQGRRLVVVQQGRRAVVVQQGRYATSVHSHQIVLVHALPMIYTDLFHPMQRFKPAQFCHKIHVKASQSINQSINHRLPNLNCHRPLHHCGSQNWRCPSPFAARNWTNCNSPKGLGCSFDYGGTS
jgi:hypothetical protein